VVGLVYVYALPATVAAPSSEDYAVYSAFVDGFVFSDRPARVDPKIALDGVVYIADETLPIKSPGSILPLEIAALGPNDMGEDFFRENNQAWRLQPRFHSRVRVSLIGSAAARGIVLSVKDAAGQSAPSKEPGGSLHAGPVGPFSDDTAVPGVLRLSRVGFNRRGTLALVYYSYRCGALCGQSGLAVLEKTGGQWHVQHFGSGGIY
jgi:hypothetical protein